MARWSRILCPVDFSRESRAALEEAAELARAMGADLTVVHVDDRPAEPGAAEGLAQPGVLERVPLELERQLGESALVAEGIAGAPVGQALLRGDPAREIAAFAARRSFDAIVTGTRGRGARDRLVFGSVAEALVREAPCSVVVVRARRPAPGPASAG
jgi:universal stress protein A